jgi:hypothetical protein
MKQIYKNLPFCLLLILLTVASATSFAQLPAVNHTSARAGNWDTGNTWSPQQTNFVGLTARTNHAITLRANSPNWTIQTLYIGNEGSIVYQGGNQKQIIGNVIIEEGGVFTAPGGNGTLVSGSVTVSGGTLNLNNMVINGDLTVTDGSVTGSGSISGTLTIEGGTYDSPTQGGAGTVITGGNVQSSNIVISQNSTLTSNLSFTAGGTLTINEGVTLNTAGFQIITPTTVNVNGTLQFPNAGGLQGATGAITGSPTLNLGANSTIHYSASTGSQTVTGRAYQNLSLSGEGLKNAAGNITVNRVLNLGSNPNQNRGQLEMTIDYGDYATVQERDNTSPFNNLNSYVLTMASGATTVGEGDVTGRINRTAITANTELTFGNANTSLTFSNTGTLPSEIEVISTIGDNGLHVDKPDAVKRLYQVLRVGGAEPNTFTVKFAYQASELNGNTAADLVTWDHHIPYGGITPHEHGKTSQSVANNWVQLSGHGIGYLSTKNSTTFTKYWMLSETLEESEFVWEGAFLGDASNWFNVSNWRGGMVPDANSANVIIPSNANVMPVLTADVFAQNLTIQEDATFDAGNAVITLTGGPAESGGIGTFSNNGTFIKGTSKVVFTSSNATIGGDADFFNLEVANNAVVTPEVSSTLTIGGTITQVGSGSLRAASTNSTIIFEGDNQTIQNLNGGVQGYYNLVLNGENITLPNSLQIKGNFTANKQPITPANSTVIFDGDNEQIVGGLSSLSFQNLLIDNDNTVSLNANITVQNELFTPSGKIKLNDKGITLKGETTAEFIGSTEAKITIEDNSDEVNLIFDSSTENASTLENFSLINSTGEINLLSNLKVIDRALINNTVISTGVASLDLGASGLLSEINNGYLKGSVKANKNMIFVEQPYDFNGIGISITTNQTIAGETEVERITGQTFLGEAESTSASRLYKVNPTNNENLDATVVLTYRAIELASLGEDFEDEEIVEDRLSVFKRPIGGDASQWLQIPSNNVSVSVGAVSGTLTITELPNFSEITFGDKDAPLSNQILPVELVFFRGEPKSGKVQLLWKTASEINNHFFEIVRMGSTRNQETVGVVYGQGTTSTATYYTFEDENPMQGLNYYQLIQTDFDGTIKAYGPVVVNVSDAQNFALISKQQRGSWFNFLLSVEPNDPVLIEVFETNGKLLYSQETQVEYHSLNFEFSAPKNGMYLARFTQNNDTFTEKFVY